MRTAKKRKNFKVTPDILKQLQESMNDTIKPNFRDKKNGKKEKSPDRSSKRNKP